MILLGTIEQVLVRPFMPRRRARPDGPDAARCSAAA